MNLIPNMLLSRRDQDVPIVISVRIADHPPSAVAEGEISSDGRPAAILLAEVFEELAATLRLSVEAPW